MSLVPLQAQAAFEPISVQHMRIPVQQRVTGCSAPLRLPPAGLPGSGEAPDLSTADLHIVFIVSCAPPQHPAHQAPPCKPSAQHCSYPVSFLVCVSYRTVEVGD